MQFTPEEIMKEYKKAYRYLYDTQTREAYDLQSRCAAIFDQKMKEDRHFKELVNGVAEYRGEPFMFDREAAAFVLAFASVAEQKRNRTATRKR